MPTLKGETCMLDLGANVDSSPAQLLQFAIMGASLIGGLHNKSCANRRLVEHRF